MWEPADVEQAILDFPSEAGDALAAIQLDPAAKRLDPAAFRVAAEVLGARPEHIWVDALDERGLLESFVRALAARGVAIDLGLGVAPLRGTNIPHEMLTKFVNAAASFGCRICKDGAVVGSGVLVGPTTVLTAWHVVARAGPTEPQEPYPTIEVLLSDNRRVEAHVPGIYSSPCGTDEYANLFPSNDSAVESAHDVAVLRLARPAGGLLGTASLPVSPPSYQSSAALLLVHYPAGTNVGIGIGSLCKIRNLNARWSHFIETAGGSSGGGCFDSGLSLIGIHQGRDPRRRGRLVPVRQFYDGLRAAVANDEAPPRMWSLDETAEGEFVIGRQHFFEAFAAVRRSPRVRGIRVKRADAAGDIAGLPFSFLMLDRTIARNPRLRLMRVSFEAAVSDVAEEIARRASDSGITIGPVDSRPGVAQGQTAPEAVGADRGRRAAVLLNQKAAELGFELWIFIDHPQVLFGDEARSALEGFIDSALQCENLRLVIAGYEAVALPGLDFYFEPPPGEGARGLMVEILTGFREDDVRLFLADAIEAARAAVSAERQSELVEAALAGLENENGVYPPWSGQEVSDRLRPEIRKLFEKVDQ